jgi:glycosyltransferase involved in cell wall biosynthesis
LRILLVHNRYLIPGGEETVLHQERSMLCAAGETVDLLEVGNEDTAGAAQKIKTALLVPYSPSGRRLMAARIAKFRPDVVHVHNFFPKLSPSIYDACRDARVPVVQTLHNYRLICANGLLFRNGKSCTDCVGHTVTLPAIVHGCYRGSRLGSAAVAAMIGIHRIRNTWAQRVDRFIALTDFARGLFAKEAQIPIDKITVKPNAAPDPGTGKGSGGYALYVGRLSPEKGIQTLLDAARNHEMSIPLKIAGSGPLQPAVEAAQSPGRIEYAGWQNPEGVRRLMLEARVLVLPSLWFEGLPMVLPEAFGAGLPIVASRIGALETLIEDGGNGVLAPPGNAAALAEAVRRIAENDAFESDLRAHARRTYEAVYHPDANLRLLKQIYEQVVSQGRDSLSAMIRP